jgi:hypothetical protein
VASLRASCPLPPPPGKELGFNGGRNLEAREKKKEKKASRHLQDDASTILKPMTGGTSQFESLGWEPSQRGEIIQVVGIVHLKPINRCDINVW